MARLAFLTGVVGLVATAQGSARLGYALLGAAALLCVPPAIGHRRFLEALVALVFAAGLLRMAGHGIDSVITSPLAAAALILGVVAAGFLQLFRREAR